MAKHEGYIKSPMTQSDHSSSPDPSGHVVTDGRTSTQGLPMRDMGPNSVPEVTYDENASVPGRTDGGK